MSQRRLKVRKEKMPVKVFYNIDNMIGPQADPKSNIVMGKEAPNRVARQRTKLSPSPSKGKYLLFWCINSI